MDVNQATSESIEIILGIHCIHFEPAPFLWRVFYFSEAGYTSAPLGVCPSRTGANDNRLPTRSTLPIEF